MDQAVKLKHQVAALPVRRVDGKLEVMLVSSRESRRWVVPKGWPMPGRTAAKAAAIEAYEEGGVQGTVEESPVGRFHYEKRQKDGSRSQCSVDVYVMTVDKQLARWPEAGERGRRWFDPAGAALAVDEPELAAIIRKLR